MSVKVTAGNTALCHMYGGGGLYREGTQADVTQDYSCCFHFKMDADADEIYRTLFFLTSDSIDYLHAAAVYIYGSDLSLGADVIVDGAGWGDEQGSGPLSAATDYHFAYVRSGTTHSFYLNGTLFGTITRDVSGHAYNEYWLCYDGPAASSAVTGLSFKHFREWQGVALTPTQINTEAASVTPVVTSGLFANVPLTSTSALSDTSGGGHHLTAVFGPLQTASGYVWSQNYAHSYAGDHTVCGWFKSHSAASNVSARMFIFNQGYLLGTPASSLSIAMGEGDNIYFGLFDGSDHNPGAGYDVPVEVWTHIAYTRTGTTNRFYVNGAQIGTDVTLDISNYVREFTRIGEQYNAAVGDFSASQFRMWEGVALTPAELKLEAASATPVRSSGLAANVRLSTLADVTNTVGSETFFVLPLHSSGDIITDADEPHNVFDALTITESVRVGRNLGIRTSETVSVVHSVTKRLASPLRLSITERIGVLAEALEPGASKLTVHAFDALTAREGLPLFRSMADGLLVVGPTPGPLTARPDYWTVGI